MKRKIILYFFIFSLFLFSTDICFARRIPARSANSSGGAQFSARLWQNINESDGKYRVKLFAYIPSCARYSFSGKPNPVIISQKCPAIIIFPGGSYCYLGIIKEGFKVAELMKSRGIAAFVLRYRTGLYGNHCPDAYDDYKTAVDYIKAGVRAGKWNIDTSKIGVIGFSAGGHLAGCAALETNPKYRPAFAGMIYPVVTMNKPWTHKKSRRNFLHGSGYAFNYITKDDQRLMDAYSLEDHVYSGMSPVFIMQCKDDGTVSVQNSITFIEKLKEQNVQGCEWHIFEKGGHGFGLQPNKNSDAEGWSDLFLKWLDNKCF